MTTDGHFMVMTAFEDGQLIFFEDTHHPDL
jgi:hypothetical protein